LKDVRPTAEAIRLTKVWRAASQNQYPIDFELLVNQIINVQSGDDKLELHKASLSEGVLGVMMPTQEQNTWAAIINENIPYSGRKNFTAAHEIFHFLGHRYKKSNFMCKQEDFRKSAKILEHEANQFASDLLMPADIIRTYMSDDFCYEVIKPLAVEFDASVEALSIRWINISQQPNVFIKSRDGFVVFGYQNKAAWGYDNFVKKGSEVPKGSLTFEIPNLKIDTFEERYDDAWGYECDVLESCFYANDGFIYTYLTLY